MADRIAPDGALPAYGLADGAGSFRRSLTARQRGSIDRALAIVGRVLVTNRALCDSSAAVKSYLRLQLGGESVEHFGVLFLDAQHRAICFERLFAGTLAMTSVYPREVVRAALAHHAHSVILAHNHPSGQAEPSRADEMLTQTLKAALALVDVRVLDHFILVPDGAVSMVERGML